MAKSNTKSKSKIKGKGKGKKAAFITRRQAIAKLQVSLPVFRKLCILKGIFPRDPHIPHASKKQTFYSLKDIKFLSHEPLIDLFRRYRVHRVRLSRAIHRDETATARSIAAQRPKWELDHLVRERYPTITHALADLDDALSLVYAYAHHGLTLNVKVPQVKECVRITHEWEMYVKRTQCLRKAFLSIKGIYYEVEVSGQKIRWISPYDFTFAKDGKEIDYKVMNTFLDFAITQLSFVLYSLYTSLGLHYPPKDLSEMVDENENENENENKSEPVSGKQSETELKLKDITSIVSNAEKAEKQADKTESVEEPIESELVNTENSAEDRRLLTESEQAQAESDAIEFAQKAVGNTLFEHCVVFLCREVPQRAMGFIVESCGGKVVFEGALNSSKLLEEETITHQLCDRPRMIGQRISLSREHIVPQWIVDSLNANTLLPVEEYEPGKPLPPHLSPFVDEKPIVRTEPVVKMDEDKEMDDEEAEMKYQKELHKELGKKAELKQKNKPNAEKAEKAEVERKLRMLPRKKQKLYRRMMHGINLKQRERERLEKKAKKLTLKTE